MTYETILIDRHDRVALITLNRPEALNALNSTVMEELTTVVNELDRDETVGCIVLTGSTKAFAAGADIKEMGSLSFQEAQASDLYADWAAFTNARTPIIAAVSGFALGGGCELAMMCDLIIAGDSAKFGQPEIKLGIIPGMGGSQRLTRAIGKAKAMEMCLTGRMMGADEAEQAGLVARVVPADDLLDSALETAATIANMSKPIAQMVKEVVNRAFESSLHEGLLFERRTFHSAFATQDQTEGMAAFMEKRDPDFKHA